MVAAHDPASGAIHELASWSYPLFRAAFLVCLGWMLFGGVLFFWRRAKVDYHAALGAGPLVHYRAVMTSAFSAWTLTLAAFTTYAFLLIAPGAFGGVGRGRDALPVLAFLAPAVVLLWPLDRAPMTCLGQRGAFQMRRAFVKDLLLPVLATPFTLPTFARTLLADVLCSMPKLFADVHYALCLGGAAISGLSAEDPSFNGMCSSAHRPYRRASFALQCIPLTMRALQSLRALPGAPRKARWRHVANAGKYSLSLCLIFSPVRSQTWLALALVSTGINSFWDVWFDWGLPRSRRRFPRWCYFGAVFTNLVARCGWAIYVSPDQHIVQQHVVLMLGCLEMCRRFQWLLFRVEHECVKLEAEAPHSYSRTGEDEAARYELAPQKDGGRPV